MSINSFLGAHISDLSLIISRLKAEFTSHDFLKKFAKEFEEQYIEFLNIYKGNGAFQTVHSQIALFLSENEITLGIIKTNKEKSENIFGEEDYVQGWRKV